MYARTISNPFQEPGCHVTLTGLSIYRIRKTKSSGIDGVNSPGTAVSLSLVRTTPSKQVVGMSRIWWDYRPIQIGLTKTRALEKGRVLPCRDKTIDLTFVDFWGWQHASGRGSVPVEVTHVCGMHLHFNVSKLT